MTKKEAQFVAAVWAHYEKNGRHDLPWRKAIAPYKILVSELMLQQTQVDRVLPKFKLFIKTWPTVAKLAVAPQAEVLRAWQGLGYNRRAKFLHLAAKAVMEQGGAFPKDELSLRRLPGVGPYTASAIMAFAYDIPTTMIETNIRQAYLHHFYKDSVGVSDAELLFLIEQTCPTERVREWYWALMDYGSHLKRLHGNINTKSKHYTKQSTFRGSDREIRGVILRKLAEVSRVSRLPKQQLMRQLSELDKTKIVRQLKKLAAEDLISVDQDGYFLK